MVKLPANTVMETLVAMVIITTIMALWSQVYLKISTKNIYEERQCGVRMLQEAALLAKVESGNLRLHSFEQQCTGKNWIITYHEVQKNLIQVIVELESEQPPVKFQSYVYIED